MPGRKPTACCVFAAIACCALVQLPPAWVASMPKTIRVSKLSRRCKIFRTANWSGNRAGLPVLVILFLICVPLAPTHAESWRYSGVDRVVALSDIHGAYDALVVTLREAGVLDDSLSWSGGETHLVITGDLVDRGADSRRVMDLVMRLESEAPRAGGRVHLTLGNHEVMNIIGDLRYVADAEFAAFAEDESAQEREKWYRQFRHRYPADANEENVRSAFDEKAPPGYFGHRAAFGPDGKYGKWLLGKPLLIVIDDTGFVHGGLPPFVAEYGLAGVNETLMAELVNFLKARSALEDAGFLSPVDGFKELPSLLAEMIDSGQLDGTLLAAAKTAIDHRNSPLHTKTGPLWYRGSSVCSELVEGDELDAALAVIGARRIVIGHTTTVTRKVQQRMSGRVLEINTGILEPVYEGVGYALIIEDGVLAVVSEKGEKGLSPIMRPRRVGYESRTIDDDRLLSILRSGTVINAEANRGAWQVVQLAAGDEAVLASFTPLPRDTGFIPELAAYRLDRMLGLDMVPVTTLREIDGRRGTLQYMPANTISERDRLARAMSEVSTCSLEKQWGAMYLFDALIANSARTPLSMLYYPDDGQLALVSHENAFGRNKGWPRYLDNVRLTIGNEWRSGLLELSDRELRDNLADVLDRRQIAALIKRRDALIEASSR